MHTIAAKAIAFREAATDDFRRYARRIVDNAAALARDCGRRGCASSPAGTENHLLLVDVGVRGFTGKAVEQALEAAGITVNKNTIPYDKRKTTVTSGIRVGTPALTTRGMGADEMPPDCRLGGAHPQRY